MALDWTVEVRGPDLIRVGQLAEADLTDFLCVPRKNTLGSWSVVLPETVLDENGIETPHALCAALRVEGAGIVVSGPQGQVLSGPMIQATQEQSPEEPNGLWTIVGVSDMEAVANVVAFPQPGNSNPATQTQSNDVRTAKGEALLRAYVSANIGPTASAARKLADLSLAPDLGRGPTLTKSPRFQNLLELCQEIGTGANLLFDVVQVDDGRQFQVLTPLDVSAAVRWDVENNQLSSAKYGYSKPGVTRVFVAGQGEGTERTIIEVTTPESLLAEAVWGRIERFIDQRNTDDVDELTQAGLEVLADEGATVKALEIVPSSDLADGFMSDWFLGSLVTVVVGEQEIVAPVAEVPIKISADGVFIGATVGDATGFDWESVLAAKQSKTESRVAALERNSEISNRPMRVSFPTKGALDAFTGWPGLVGFVEADSSEYVWLAGGWAIADTGWVTYLPTVANITVGNGTVIGRYRKRGKSVEFTARFQMGSTSAMGSTPTISLPITAATGISVALVGQMLDAGSTYLDVMAINALTSVTLWFVDSSGPAAALGTITATAPMTWAVTDWIQVGGVYECV